MRREEYIRIQVESSVWTRTSPNSMALVRDAVREFRKYAPEAHRVLEAGCGDGYSIDVLKAKGYQRVVGCDINLAKLKVAASFGHTVIVQDLHNLGFRSQVFDAVYCTHTLEHTYGAYQALQEICRVLRPGGLVFIIVPDHFRLYGDTFVEPHEVIPIEERPRGLFEDILFERRGIRSSTPRNQFPFTMKLLLAVLVKTGFDVQWAARIARDGPELWAIATKPELESDSVKPLISRAWSDQPSVSKLWRKLTKRVKSLLSRFR
jgi:SAM-dependent methyltransferase